MQSIRQQVIQQVELLPEPFLREVSNFINFLLTRVGASSGSSGQRLLKFAGCISEDDLDLMADAITTECSQIDADEW